MCVKCHKCEMDTHVKYYSTHVKCYSTRVTWNFTHEVHIYMLQETWSMQTRDMNSISSCVSIRVQAPRFEVIIELYCSRKVWQGEILVNSPFLSIWWKKVRRMNSSASRLSIVTTNLYDFSLANHQWFAKFAKLSPRQTFPLYGTCFDSYCT